MLALAYPGLMLINGVFFHVLPTVVTNRFSPGLITACLLFFFTCYFAFKEPLARQVEMGTIGSVIGIGTLIMAFPVLLIKTKDLPFFDQKR